MSMSTIGNILYINQTTPVTATIHQENISRGHLQEVAAMNVFQAKEEKVIQTTPTTESHAINPDTEQQGHSFSKEKEKRQSSSSPETQEENSGENPYHLLDLTV